MIPNILISSNKNQGSSFLSPAHGCGGARATIEFYNSPSAKKSGEARKQAGKKEGGLGEGIFARLLCLAKRGWGWESVSAIPASAGRQNRKIFVSLIEKNFGGVRMRINKCKENFSVLSVVRRAETLGGIQSAKSSGFCSKWVRVSSNKHHHIGLAASLGASPLASAGRLASKLKGFLKSISSRPAARRRFTNEICFA